MGIFQKAVPLQDFMALFHSVKDNGIQKFWEDYTSVIKRNEELEDALSAERCARADTEDRCKSLYASLQEEKGKYEELSSRNSVLQDCLAKAENLIRSLENTIVSKDASIKRLAKLCFGRKSEALRRVLGKKGYEDLLSVLGQAIPDEIQILSDNRAGIPDPGEGTKTEAATQEEMPVGNIRGSADGQGRDGDNCVETGTAVHNGEGREPEGGGKKEDGREKKRGKRNLKRAPGFLDNYCDTKEGAVYTFDNINYTGDELADFLEQEGKLSAYLSSDIGIYTTLEYCPGFYYTKYHLSPTVRRGDTAVRGLRLDRILNASCASPSVLSHLAVMKYRQGLPVNAFCDIAAAEGGRINRGTAAGWLYTSYEKLLKYVHMALLQYAKKHCALIGDETYAYRRVNGKVETSYFWGIRTSPLEKDKHQVVFYAFDDTRQSAVPLFYLHGYNGKFLTDGYIAYESFETKDGGVIRCCCWVHGRRVLIEALPGGCALDNLAEGEKTRLWAWSALCIISEMFRLEKEWKGLDPEVRLGNRQEKLAPLIDCFFEKAHKAAGDDSFDQACEEGKAVMYFLKREPAFRRLLEDGSVPLSTNDIERCNIVVALTRKRAKVYDSLKGANAAGGYFSLICTALANGVSPEKYLEFLYTVMPSVLHEHWGKVDQYMKYLKEASRRFEAVKDKRKHNSSAPDEIDWEGLVEPDLSFLMDVMPWSGYFAAFLKLDTIPGRKSILDAMTRKNIEESTVSMEAMRKILYTEKNLSNSRLDGLREVLEAMPPRPETEGTGKCGAGSGIVRGMHVYSTHYPARLLEILDMREAGTSHPASQVPHDVTTDRNIIPGTAEKSPVPGFARNKARHLAGKNMAAWMRSSLDTSCPKQGCARRSVPDGTG